MPTRSCIICRKRNDKKELIRIACLKDGNIVLDKSQKVNARGIYLCRDKECTLKLENNIRKGKIKVNRFVCNEKLFEILDDIKCELEE